MAEQTQATPDDTIDLGKRVVPGGFFLLRPDAPTRTPFVPERVGRQDAFRHCFTYAGGGSTIQDELIGLIDGAREKVFVATLYLGDAGVREALVRAADRLRGGVYVLAALDDRGLDKSSTVDDDDDVDKQTEYRNFKVLTTRGIYVRGYLGLHAKYVVVDDAVALVSSANLATRAFTVTGENGVVVTDRTHVRALATAFARLWARSTYDLPPSRSVDSVRHRTPSRAPRLPEVTGNGPVWTIGTEARTVSSTLTELIDGASRDVVLATYSLLGSAHPLADDKPVHPELLLEPVRAAVARGVDVTLLLRGRNIGDATRREASAFAEAGARIIPDRLNHAKGVIADATNGALFSANFVLGLQDGVEVGMRIDGTTALAEASRYFAHAITEADLTFAQDPIAADLTERLYAESFSSWPHQAPLAVTARSDHWMELAMTSHFALFERESDRLLTIQCGRNRWRLTRANDHWTLDKVEESDRTSEQLLEHWLEPRYKSKLRHGICAAALRRVEVPQ